jgi:hypothetical protein
VGTTASINRLRVSAAVLYMGQNPFTLKPMEWLIDGDSIMSVNAICA